MTHEEPAALRAPRAGSFRARAQGPDQTGAVAACVAGRLLEGDAVLLTGDLAAGKTTFVAALVAALGSADVVTSPTFALAQFYRAPAAPVLHIDTYRLADVAEFRDLGLEEFLASSIVLVEWGELVADEFLDPLRVDLATDPERSGEHADRGGGASGADPDAPDVRWITLTAGGSRWDGDLDALEADVRRVVA